MTPQGSHFTVSIAHTTLDIDLSEEAAKVYGDTLADQLGGRDQVKPAHDACAPLLARYNREEALTSEEREAVERLARAEDAAWEASAAVWAMVPGAETAEIYFQIVYHDDGTDKLRLVHPAP